MKSILLTGKKSAHINFYKYACSVAENSCNLDIQRSFKEKDLEIILKTSNNIQDRLKLAKFGNIMSAHMFIADYYEKVGWMSPKIIPFQDLNLHPASSGLHYGTQIFEGMKAYRTIHGKIHLFRAMDHVDRLIKSAIRICLPIFDKNEFLKCLVKLISVDQAWCPPGPNMSLYIRPFMFATEDSLGLKAPTKAKLVIITCPVRDYFTLSNNTGISLYTNPLWVRSWPGGVGNIKTGGNYAPTILLEKYAQKMFNCQQILWLFNDEITECGTMNIFIYMKNQNNKMELVTPSSLNGLILPGITRKSILELVRQWKEIQVSERTITLNEIKEAYHNDRLIEIFGTGTACTISPICQIVHNDFTIKLNIKSDSLANRVKKELMNIHYGITESDWTSTKIPIS